MQADQNFLNLVAQGPWRPAYSRQTDLADSIMTAIVLAPFAPATTRFTELGRLRVQECERVKALRTELTKCGARVEESGDTLTIHPGPLHGAEIETYNDHRIAMCFGMLGLRVPGMRLSNPACVRKTFPNFFAKLAELGTVIKDAGRQTAQRRGTAGLKGVKSHERHSTSSRRSARPRRRRRCSSAAFAPSASRTSIRCRPASRCWSAPPSPCATSRRART